jgi:hypothetical protein
MLEQIVAAHLDIEKMPDEVKDFMQTFIDYILAKRGQNDLIATDQLMNAVFMANTIVMENRGETQTRKLDDRERKNIEEMIEEIVLQAISHTN